MHVHDGVRVGVRVEPLMHVFIYVRGGVRVRVG